MSRIAGRDAIKKVIQEYGGSGAGFFSLKNDGDRATVRFLHTDDKDLEIYVVHKLEDAEGHSQYVECLQNEDCPLCKANNKASVKVFLVLYDIKEEKVLVWDRGPSIIDDLLGLIDKYGYLNNRNYEIVRHGKAKDTKTSYQLFNEDKGPLYGKDGKEMELPKRPEVLGKQIRVLSVEEMTKLVAEYAADAEGREARKAGAGRQGPRNPGF